MSKKKNILIGVAVALVATYQIGNWWLTTDNTYDNDRRTCRELYSHFQDLLKEGDVQLVKKAAVRLSVSISNALEASGSPLSKRYDEDSEIRSIVNGDMRAYCARHPDTKFTRAVRDFASTH